MLKKIKRILKALPSGEGWGGVLLVFAFAACTTQKTSTTTPTLVGKWKMTETLADIGDGKAKWAAVSKDSSLISEFKTDGSITGNAMPGTTHYAIADSLHLNMTIEHNADLIDYRYKVSKDTLLLNPPCREACGMKFIRLK
ncbi:hypothetical protein ACFQ3S_18810 [Mucilaginibacter terrae]|uniref:hypothetical protein n=1 Tax=Mucilaginibacter terrae TaxID=1955052 RepID=UPI0036252EC3